LGKDAVGRSHCDPDCGELVKFCAIGADAFVRGRSLKGDYFHVYYRISPRLAQAAADMLAAKHMPNRPDAWDAIELINDGWGHRAVLELFERAIAIANGPQECATPSELDHTVPSLAEAPRNCWATVNYSQSLSACDEQWL